MIAALLLGRRGSVGFPGKNLHPVLGRPMAAYPMRAARAARLVDRAYISTDDDVLMALAREHGFEVIVRPPHLATTSALGEHAYVHGYEVIRHLAAARGEQVEQMVLLFCNAPTITGDMIDRGITALRQHPDYDSAVTVSAYNMWSPLRARRETAEGLLEPFVPFESIGDPRTLNCDRDSQGDVWFADMSLSVVRPHCLERLDEGLLPQKWMGRRIYPLKQWGGCDVDFEWQVPQVEFWLLAHGVQREPAAAPAAAGL
jgi:molybdopterin-guanine dinucleotide biosynthesis protein A